MPYEIVARDVSKTNYSSARAALLEAWRIFGFYQKWLVDSFCQKVWEMVLEEAWLRGMITLPALLDPSVKAICLKVNSPGGDVDGIKELSDFLYRASRVKSIYAYADGQMCSAASCGR